MFIVLFFAQLVTYTDKTESIHVVWEDYSDEESGIKSFSLRLLEAASCRVELEIPIMSKLHTTIGRQICIDTGHNFMELLSRHWC